MRFFAVFAFVLLGALSARADLGNLYGFGPVSAGLTGSDRAWSSDGYTVAKNPALMSLFSDTLLTLGFFGTYDSFSDLEDVVVDKPELGGSSVQRGRVETDVVDAANFLLGSVWSISSRPSQPRLGIALSVPVLRMMEPQSKDIYQPQYAMYLSDSQRLTVNISGSIKVSEAWSLGVGAHYYLAQGATLTGRLPTGTGKTSTMNIKMDVRPVIAPIFAVAGELGGGSILSLNYSGLRDARLSMKTNQEIGFGAATATLAFNATSSLWFDPETWSVSYSRGFEKSRFYATLDYERWSSFDGAIMKLDFETFGGGWSQNRPDTSFKDVLVPRLGFSFDDEYWIYRFGYAWRPSATPDLSGETNFLDSSRHCIGLGASRVFHEFLGVFEKPVRLDSHVQAHVLVPRKVQKTNATSIGANEYTVQGTMWSYGLSLTMGI